MAFRPSRRAVVVILLMLPAAAGVAASKQTATANRANDKLMQLAPADRAATLARAVKNWCIGTEAFPMGVETAGAAAGYAYWSLRCADGTTWAVQIDPFAAVTAIDCETFKANGAGKECFQKF